MDAAAPDAQHVQVRRDRELEQPIDRRIVAAGHGERRRGNPVRARHRDAHAVHEEREARAIRVRGRVEHARTQADPPHLARTRARDRTPIRIHQLDAHRVHRLPAEAARPPAFRPLDLERRARTPVLADRHDRGHRAHAPVAVARAVALLARRARRPTQLAAHEHAIPRRTGHAGDVDVHRDLRALGIACIDERPNGLDPSRAPALDADVAGNAGGGHARPPVPAEVAGALADERVRRPVAVHRPRPEPRLLGAHVRHRGAHADDDRVRARAHRAAHVEPPRHELARAHPDRHAVQLDLRHGVDRVEAQLDRAAAEHLRGHVDPPRPRPVGVADPGLAILPVADVERRQHARAPEVEVHAPRNLGRERTADDAVRHLRVRARRALHRPCGGIGADHGHRAPLTRPARRRNRRGGTRAGRVAAGRSRGCRRSRTTPSRRCSTRG